MSLGPFTMRGFAWMNQWWTDVDGDRAVIERHPLLWEVGYKDITMVTSSNARRRSRFPTYPSLAERCST
jgi:hypothetical protein